MTEFKSDKRITSMLTTSLVVYIIGAIALGIIIATRASSGSNSGTFMLIFAALGVVLLFLAFRVYSMFMAARGAFIKIDGDTVTGTHNPSPKTRRNVRFSINKNDILSITKVDAQVSMVSTVFYSLAINTANESYRCFGVERVDEIIALLRKED